MCGLKSLAVTLLIVACIGCCSGCDDTAAMMQRLPDDYSTQSIADDIKSAIGEGTKITSQLADLSQSQGDLMRLQEQTLARLADQTITNRDKIDSLTKYVSTLEETVKEAATKTSVSEYTYGEVDDLKEKVAALEKRLTDLETRCQSGKVQTPAAQPATPVKSAVSGYGSTGSRVSSSVSYSYSQPMAVKSGGSNGSQYQSEPYAPLPASGSYYQQPAIVTEIVEQSEPTCYEYAPGKWICDKPTASQSTTTSRGLLHRLRNR